MSTPCAIDALNDRVPVFEADRYPADLSERERSSRTTHVAVVDAGQRGRFLGLLSLKDLMERRRGAELIFGDLVARKKTLRVAPETPLSEVVDQLTAHQQDAAAVVDDEGEYLGAVTIDEARQRLESHQADARADDERHFRATFEQAAVGVAQVAPDGRWLDMNARLCTILGYTREELLSGSFQAITHPDDLNADLDQVRRVLAGDIATYSMEKRYRRKDGAYIWANLTVSLVRDASGKPLYFISVVEDIDARKQAEVRLAEAAANIELMVKASNIGLWDWDLSTNRVHFSREWKSQLGYAEHEITDDFGEWERRVHPDDLPPTLARVQKYLADPSVPYEVEFRMRHKNGSWRWIYARGEVARDASGNPGRMLGCHIDITDRKQAEAIAFAAAEREAVATIAAGVSHEFNSLLTAAAIQMHRHESVCRIPDNETCAKALSLVDQARSLAAALLNLYAGPETSRTQLMGLHPWLSETVARLATALPAGIHVETEVEFDLPEAMAHRLGLEQVVRNLLINAANAMGDTGEIRVRASLTTVDGRAMVEVRVSDDGPGIPEALRPRIFAPGFSTKPRSYRTGLGLAIASRLAEQFGGMISFEPNTPSGSTFVIRLLARDEENP